jgi:methyltransferase (TIGR00027 family)
MKRDKPSNTALIVASGLQLVQACAATAHVLPDEAIARGAALMQKLHPRMAALLRQAWFRRACLALERATLPGISLHFALRKRVLRDHAHRAIQSGCRQVVVLGAGFDTLCAELAVAYPQLVCIEIDHPATQADKRRAAGECVGAVAGECAREGTGFAAATVHYLGADLAQRTLATVLAECPAFQSTLPTLYVAEGLLMYVPLQAVSALLVQMAASPDSQLAFTWLEPQADGLPNFSRRSRLVDAWLRLRGEPFLSGMSRRALPGYLAGVGFALEVVADSVDLLDAAGRRALGPAGLPLGGEYIGIARARAPAGAAGQIQRAERAS